MHAGTLVGAGLLVPATLAAEQRAGARGGAEPEDDVAPPEDLMREAGRRVTEQITQLATAQTLKNPSSAATLKESMRQFIRMYEPHEAREDTVLFPALRSVVSPNEFDALGEDFEKQEQQLFGKDGFEKIVERVASIEKSLGIYDLAQFTPRG